MTMIGSSPLEAPDETWGVGQGNGAAKFNSPLVRYTRESGWSLGPRYEDAAGNPLTAFRLAAPDGATPSPLAGEITPTGSGVLGGEVPALAEGQAPRQILLVRDPGGAFRETAVLPEAGATALQPGESLFAPGRAPLLAALEESPSKAGALVVPVRESGPETSVLHWDGSAFSREPIDVPAASSSDFRVLAIGASAPSNAWLLAQLSSSGAYPAGAVALFRRRPPSGETPAAWVPVALTPGGGDEEAHPLSAGGGVFTVAHTGEPPSVQAQILTVTGEGVWIDGERSDIHASTTMLFRPMGQGGGEVVATWCSIPSAHAGATPCAHELPEPLPTGPSRSFAWANAATPEGLGERVITGLPEGVTLRLDGTSFTRVLGLGGSPESSPGGAYGAAFSSASEGWLGQQKLPTHLTRNFIASRLTPWPVSFRHALLAVAPQPGAPIGALSSQALAVGDQGEVARYLPGRGWTPESLLSAGGRHETPRLRAVAWPTPTRAFAVGDSGTSASMWLWRGETGLWEPDPATPYNFRGNLLGIAFDPNNPARGYAVGENGVLLSHGKSWTQESSLPPEVAGASFTSIAFAGSEAIVAYRKLVNPSQSSSYVGGLLVNEGAGWHVDQSAASAIGSEVPLVVAGLADGGAAFAAQSFSSGEGARIFERDAGGGWQPVATPFPGGAAPGSLALFREGGALRVIASGTAPAGFDVESAPPSPPGFPPPLIEPYGVGSNVESGVLRQTASGWSDEQHELNNATEPPGQYSRYDTVFQPDPVAAVLVDPTGAQGWAVGGFVDNVNKGGVLDTADIERYPADGVTPTGIANSSIALEPSKATFAIGGGAQCAAPCAERAEARIGPDVWLQAAIARASAIGVRAFIYTGPRVTAGATVGPPTLALPYASELGRYASLLGTSAQLPTFAAASPFELDGQRGEGASFGKVFAGFPKPFGPSGAIAPAGSSGVECAGEAGCASAYYAFDSHGPEGGTPTRVIVLDDSADVQESQLTWLEGQLVAASQAHEPAIVVGNADLNAQIAAGEEAARRVAQSLLAPTHSASAYFFDSPEHNVKERLQLGGASIPAFGSGTLGYVSFLAEKSGAFTGASGFLLAEVNLAKHDPTTNIAEVSARLIPNIGELALEAHSGTLLHRSQVATFAGLARRPRSGNVSRPGQPLPETDPYIPIPSICVQAACANGIQPEYTFTSSRPDFGDFVEPNLALSPEAVLLSPEGRPIPDPKSGLFCAYNAGTTIVTISAGGLSASLPVTIQAGSVRRPCGTTALKELPADGQQPVPVAPAPAPAPAGSAPTSAPAPLVTVPPAPPVPPKPAHTPAPFLLTAQPTPALLAILPPPLPTPARPTPPSGTSPVTSPVEAPEKEEEEERATESVGNNAAAYRQAEHETPPAYLLALVLLAAFAGASARRRPGRGRREVRVAPATITAARWQRSVSQRGRNSRLR
ncbi:MAG TPA: hypothetical protein VFY36_01040 [Solirubrobacteraceae bacterium]|nr:hypothetical protein [Solirubrobacteraceae bacterium]